MTDPMIYKGWQMDFDMKPIPIRDCDWTATHPDFDGVEDGNTMQVNAATQKELMAEIDAWIYDNGEEA